MTRHRRAARTLAASVALTSCLCAMAEDAHVPADNGGNAMTERPPVQSRKDAFFGIHFDLHANMSDTALGADVAEEMVARLLDAVRPDFVQQDTKGHGGYASYPTQVGTAAPGISKDALAIWRKVTRERNVLLYAHYSGLFDGAAVRAHPEWARLDPEGNPHQDIASTYGPYVREVLIPQLIELAQTYDFDGAWVDGDGWAAMHDYGPAAREEFQRATGLDVMPTEAGDPHWDTLRKLQRQRYRDYVREYVDAVHAAKPGFDITSVAFYGPLSPERPDLPLDFVSGDYSASDSVNRARMDARIFTSVGLPWDLMAWGFNAGEGTGHAHKSAAQLQQEAAVTLSQGGAFQIFYQPTRTGWVDDAIISVAAEVGQFCRARQSVSHKTETVPQVALMLPEAWFYREWHNLFGGWSKLIDPSDGLLRALLELHYSVDVMGEWRLLERLDEYPVVVVPECGFISDEVRAALLGYVDGGGNLLVVGAQSVQPFREELGVEFSGEPSEQTAYVRGDTVLGWVSGEWQAVRPDASPHKSRSMEVRYAGYDTRPDGACAATVTDQGDGKMAAIYGPLGSVYFHSHSPPLRQFLGRIMRELFPEPLVELEGPPSVDLAVRRHDDALLLHLMNLTGMATAPRYPNVDEIVPVGQLTVRVRLDEAPTEVALVPSGAALDARWTDGVLDIAVPSVHVHEVIVIR